MDKCHVCGEKERLWYMYPLPKELKLSPYQGIKLCEMHQKMLIENIKEFKEVLDAARGHK